MTTGKSNGSDRNNGSDEKHESHKSHSSPQSSNLRPIIPPRGDYQTLLSYQKAEVVYGGAKLARPPKKRKSN